MRIVMVAAAIFAGAASVAAHATVKYNFTALSSVPDQNGETYSGSFSYTAPGFIVPTVLVPVASLTSCTVVGSLGPHVCGDVGFRDGFAEFGLPTVFVAFTVSATRSYFYHFAPSAFGTTGTHNTVLFGTAQQGVLVVGDVPEPASWALMIAGFGMVGTAVRRRRKVIFV